MAVTYNVDGKNGRVVLSIDGLGTHKTSGPMAIQLGKMLIAEGQGADCRDHVLVLDVDVPEERQSRNIMANAIRILVENNEGQLTFDEIADLVNVGRELEGLKDNAKGA